MKQKDQQMERVLCLEDNVDKFSKEIKQTFAECDFILNNLDDEIKNKISRKFINMIKENKDNEFAVAYEEGIALEDQKFSDKTYGLLALIYLKFLCDDKEEKKEILKLIRKNK